MRVTITTDNAAFGESDYEMRAEVARILREIADDLDNGKDGGPCIDINGNTVGRWSV